MFAEVFGLNLAEFDAMWRGSRIEQTVGEEDGIPVINRAPAGLVVDYEEYGVDSGQGFEYLPRGTIQDRHAFAVIVVGDSMEPTLVENDYLIFSPLSVPNPSVRLMPGNVVFVRFSEESEYHGCTLARWEPRAKGRVRLTKDNKEYEAIDCRPEEIRQLAVAIELRTQRRL